MKTTKQLKALARQMFLDNKALDIINLTEEELKVINEIIQSYEYVKHYEKEEGKILCERLRNSYIGEKVYTIDGTSYISTMRGRPTGTIVAVKKDDKILFGYSILSNDTEHPTPIVGEYLALQKLQEYEDGKYPRGLDEHEKKQFDHFKLRAKCFFFPETYSHSKGLNPIVYPNYERIHSTQIALKNLRKN